MGVITNSILNLYLTMQGTGLVGFDFRVHIRVIPDHRRKSGWIYACKLQTAQRGGTLFCMDNMVGI